jgi:hypothetical protein
MEHSSLPYLPSDLETINGFLRLLNLDLSTKSHTEVLSLYFHHVPFLPAVPIPCHSPKPETVFRVVRCSEIPRGPARLGHPPAELTPRGRLNIARHPVFYTSDKPLISILEMNPQHGEELYVGIWNVRNFDDVMICPMLVDYQGSVPVLLKQKQLLLDSISKMELEVGRRYLTVYRLMTELLVGGNHHLSSAIGHFLFNDMVPRRTDVIIYPSVKANRQHANFAFSTEMFNSRFHFVGGLCVVVQELAGDQQSGRFLCVRQTTMPFHSVIEWKEEQPPREIELTVGV